MEDVLRWSLLVIGGCIIVGVAAHGIWLSRKNSEGKSTDKVEDDTELELTHQEWTIGEEDTENQDTNDISDFNIDVDSQDVEFTADTATPITSAEQFDDLGIGAVRVVSSNKESASEEASTHTTAVNKGDTQQEKDLSVPVQTTKEHADKEASGKIYASVVTQPKPEFAEKYQSLAAETVAIAKEEKNTSKPEKDMSFNVSQVSNSDLNPAKIAGGPQENYQAPEPPPFLLKKQANAEGNANQSTANPSSVKQNADSQSIEKSIVTASQVTNTKEVDVKSSFKESLTEQARNLVKRKKAVSARKKKEPKIDDDQMRIDFEDEPISTDNEIKTQASQEKPSEQQEVLVLNVKVADGTSIAGSALLPMLLTLGFKFGDQDIFHRHVNSNGKGPVLFSLANMFKPGNFDIDNLENFTTQGVSLFMILPIEGEPHQVFNMMHNAARKIADEFSAQIYDARRSLLTKQSLQQYVEKIREFERQRIVNR
ncbi:cell division protein ZipA [Paraglaciecola sp.]|uniref:cell division protein ZipA n=1 Tax=Paraglaciecola sp. TaxID=1920173 RepID=UPI003EF540BF